jgi:cytoskeletal protein CcmA (bactofilin family)
LEKIVKIGVEVAIKSGSSEGKSTELNFIGNGTSIEGDLKTNSSIRVDGKIKGTLKCEHTLTVGESGQINGAIEAKNAVIGGKIEGKVIVQEKLVLETKSKLVGELKAKKLIIDEGAVFDGASDMGVGPGAPAPKQAPPDIE